MHALEVKDITLRFAGLTALSSLSIALPSNQTYGLIGPNGAGKTSLFNCIMRLYRQESGRIYIYGQDTTNLEPYQVAALNVARTFQNLALIPHLTVRENILVGTHIRRKRNILKSLFLANALNKEEQKAQDTTEHAIEIVGLQDVAEISVDQLPYATLKLVELARALASEPSLLLLDEPAGGLSHAEALELGNLIKKLQRDKNLTILVVEHNMSFLKEFVDSLVVLNFGMKIAEGHIDDVTNDKNVIAAYLGETV